MTCNETNGGVLLTGCESFDARKTLESGQMFRFKALPENEYQVCAGEKMVYVAIPAENRERSNAFSSAGEADSKRNCDIAPKSGELFFHPCGLAEFQGFWRNYFDLARNYKKINEALIKNDGVMERAVSFGSGVRILNQAPFETLISFIVSQRKNIPAIKKTIENICAFAGADMGEYYAFPTAEALAALTCEDFVGLKTGFRAKYLFDAAQKIRGGKVSLEKNAAAEARRGELLKIRGVGGKVADCVLLFALGARETFPIDVWVKRAVETLYFGGESKSLSEIAAFARAKFGENAGYAQQYLFYYARSHGLRGGKP